MFLRKITFEKKFIVMFVAIFLVMGLTNCTFVQPSETYFNESFGLTLQLPPDWELQENENGVFLWPNEDTSASISITEVSGMSAELWDGDEFKILNSAA